MPTAPTTIINDSPACSALVSGCTECTICGAPAAYRHFGNKLVCSSCAAFFRRTVAQNKTYSCKTRGNCSTRFGNRSPACKLCRFRRCIAVGMSVNAVVSAPRKSGALTALERLVQARKAVYINRFRAMSDSCGELQADRLTPVPMTTQAAEMAIKAEFAVVCDFLQQSGIVDPLAGDARIICQHIASSFLYAWTIYEWMQSTIRNFGHFSHRLYFLDDNYLDVTEGNVAEYYGTDSNILDPWHVGRLSASCFMENLETARKFALVRLDEVEHAVLTLILLLRSVQDLWQDDSLRLGPLLDSVFRSLRDHYKQTYEDYALRLDTIVHLADEIQRIRRMFDEHVTILRLYGKKTVLSKLQEDIRNENPLPVE